MARYIVLRVESNETADRLLERFAPVSAIEVVGLFASPTKFCDESCPTKGKSVRSRKWGTRHCPDCKLPRKSAMHQPRNLLQDVDLHPKFVDFFISVWEPFHNRPEEKHGAEVVERVRQQTVQSQDRLNRRKRRNRRKVNSGG